MPEHIDLLSPSFGIQDVIEMSDFGQLPRARELAANALNAAGLEDLYPQGNARQLIEQALCPNVGDGSLLNSQRFQSILDSIIAEADEGDDPALVAMVRQELIPLRQNKELLQAYLGLMIGG